MPSYAQKGLLPFALLVGCVRIGYEPENEPKGSLGGQSSDGAGSGGVSHVTSNGLGGTNGGVSHSGGTGYVGAGGSFTVGGTTFLATGGSSLATGGTNSQVGGSTSSLAGAFSSDIGGNQSATGGVAVASGGSSSSTATASSAGGSMPQSGGASSSLGGVVNSGGATFGGYASATGGSSLAGASSSAAGGVSFGGNSAANTAGTGGCDWSSAAPAFGSPISAGLLNTDSSEIDPVLSHDGLSLYYVAWSSAQGNDIYVATRTKLDTTFDAGVIYAQVDSPGNDTHLFVGPDGLEAFVASDRIVRNSTDILRATRVTTSDPWGAFGSIDAVNSVGSEFNPHLETDRLTLWFDAVNRPGQTTMQDIFYARRASPVSDFLSPVPATTLNSSADDWDASLTDDGLVILFQSTRGSARHVYYATRASRSVEFGAPAIVTSLEPYLGSFSDPFISPDGCSIYFAAKLVGTTSNDIYRVDVL